jgi:hypothetical protein
MRFALAGLALASAAMAAAPAAARSVEPGVYDYFIHHSIHGRIGEHRMTVERNGDALVIEHDSEIALGLLFTVIYRREARSREVWQDDRLVSFESVIDDNGTIHEVRARAEGDRLLIEGSNGAAREAPGDVATTQPSFEDAIERQRFLKVATGEVVEASVEPTGPDSIMLNGRDVAATRYRLSGELGREIWFDDAGLWVKWQLERGGGTVTLMRR